MDEQGISSVFKDRLNPTLYDYRAYERECPYAPTHATRQGSLTTLSSDSSSNDLDSSLTTSPLPQPTVTDKVATKIASGINDVMDPVSIKGRMSQSSENHVDEFVARSYEETNEGEFSINGGMPLFRIEAHANQTLATLLVETPRPIPQNAL
ncbi:hypothetical protein LIER_22423 [Lithospermum erythrorhizon]|uniref:Uncharacterized protein n=1 Tax=Lithospermum erythrorhizon TaxID=34254 RepID=A0AAV3QWW4_LITER